MSYATGQLWTYKAPEGFENSRIVIGAVATCTDDSRIICFSVSNAPANGSRSETTTIPFIPMREDAFAKTVKELVGEGEPPESFSVNLTSWSEDARGLSVFTVPFEGFLDRMIALQMAAIVGQPAA